MKSNWKQGAMKASSVQTVTIPVTAQTAVLVMPLPGHVFAFMVTWDLRVVRPAPRVGMGTTVRIHVTVSMEGFVAERKGDVNVCRGFSGDCVKMSVKTDFSDKIASVSATALPIPTATPSPAVAPVTWAGWDLHVR